MNDWLSSKELFLKEHSSKEKYEYFICTVAGALFAYIAQTYTPHILNSWFYFLMPLALLFLTFSFTSGLIRIFISNDIVKINKDIMHQFEDCVRISDQLAQNFMTYSDHCGKQYTRKDLEDKRVVKNELIKLDEGRIQPRMKWARFLAVVRDISLALAFLLILASKIYQPYQS